LIPSRNGGGGALPFGELGRLGKYFVRDLESDYDEHGTQLISWLRINDPKTYVKLLLALSPRYGNGDETWLAFENDLVEAFTEWAKKTRASKEQAAAPPPEES
jgi:hypothetical protein